METTLPKNDLELHKTFEIILSIKTFSNYIIDIAKLIYEDNLSKENIQKIIDINKIHKVENIKEELLDLLIVYINLVLNDHIITDNERKNIILLKKYFKIEEGDFYKKRYYEVADILQRQFERLYNDNIMDKEEVLYAVELQDIFDLGYDQFEEFKEHEVIKALKQGANILDLDITKYPKINDINYNEMGKDISQQIKDFVWNRDNGQCTECKSYENLNYYYLIPYSKGGSNTPRNIKLLCESCTNKINN